MEKQEDSKLIISIDDILKFAENLGKEDKRLKRKQIHPAEMIIFIALAAVICGVETWDDMEIFAIAKSNMCKRFFPNFVKPPSHDTFCRFFSALKPEVFEIYFRQWIRDIMGDLETKGVIAIDGKTISKASETEEEKLDRKTNPNSLRKSRLHIVSAFSHEYGISLGQIKTEEKSNEITAIPELIKSLDVKGCVITTDALGCQKEIAKTIVENGGDYLFVVKDNHKNLKNWLKDMLESNSLNPRSKRDSSFTTYDKGHGRIEERTCFATHDSVYLGEFKDGWTNIQTVARIINKRTIKASGKTTTEYKYVISSLNVSAEKIMEYSRAHWSVENKLHWQLDVSFNEDNGRMKNNAAENFSILSKMALTVLKNNNKHKASIKSKRKLAGWLDQFLFELINAV